MVEPPENWVRMVVFLTEVDFSQMITLLLLYFTTYFLFSKCDPKISHMVYGWWHLKSDDIHFFKGIDYNYIRILDLSWNSLKRIFTFRLASFLPIYISLMWLCRRRLRSDNPLLSVRLKTITKIWKSCEDLQFKQSSWGIKKKHYF